MPRSFEAGVGGHPRIDREEKTCVCAGQGGTTFGFGIDVAIMFDVTINDAYANYIFVKEIYVALTFIYKVPFLPSLLRRDLRPG